MCFSVSILKYMEYLPIGDTAGLSLFGPSIKIMSYLEFWIVALQIL